VLDYRNTQEIPADTCVGRVSDRFKEEEQTGLPVCRAIGVAELTPLIQIEPPVVCQHHGCFNPQRSPKTGHEVTTDFGQQISPPVGNQDRSASACEPYRDLIEQGLGRGRNAMAIWQDLVCDHGFPGGYETVKRFVRKLRGSDLPEAVGIILTAVGEEAQVDYGSGPMVRDPQSGKYRRTRLFVMTLGYSRKSVRLLVWRSSSRVWAELHEQALPPLGGESAQATSRARYLPPGYLRSSMATYAAVFSLLSVLGGSFSDLPGRTP
jgi:hypothetical protein